MADLIHIEAQLGEETYRFALGWTQLVELETGRPLSGMPVFDGRKPRPVYEIFQSIMAGRIKTDEGSIGNPLNAHASVADICAVVRLGLIGGGDVDAEEASEMMEEFGPPKRPVGEMWEIASALLYAVLVGVDEPVRANA